MRTRTILLLAGAGSLLAAWVARGAAAERDVPYETVEQLDAGELRRYPATVLVETTAPDERTAFRRLFRYFGGANDADAEVSMTAPVATRSAGTEVPRAGPIRTRDDEAHITMAFYLPASYDADAAPAPTDPEVRLVVEPERIVAAASFSWFATRGRVRRRYAALREVLADGDAEPTGDPALLRYDPPWTPPFLRTNEVVVAVDAPVAERDAGHA